MAVAKQTKHVLQSLGLLTEEQQKAPEFFTNGNPEVLKNLLPQPREKFLVSHLEF